MVGITINDGERTNSLFLNTMKCSRMYWNAITRISGKKGRIRMSIKLKQVEQNYEEINTILES